MLKKLVALGALSAALVVAPNGGASADTDYAGTPLPTKTIIDIISISGPGKPVVLDVSATANSELPPEGDITLTVLADADAGTARAARAARAPQVYSITVHFTDEPVRVRIKSLPEGIYDGYASFTPSSGDEFLPSDTTKQIAVSEVAGESDNGGDAGGDGDDLPNTGGPNMMWLLLGGGLVGAGAGGVSYGRRREDALV